MKNLDVLFQEAQDCKDCPSIPYKAYREYKIPFPVPTYDKTFNGSKVKIVFVLESPGIAEGGAAQTGKISCKTNFDQSAQKGQKLLKQAGIFSKGCFFTNAILHAAITNAGKMRKPSISEIKNCNKYLKRIIDELNPRIVAPMGSIALKALNYIDKHPYKRITKCAGKEFNWYNRIAFPLVLWSGRGLANRNWDLQLRDLRNLKSTLAKLR